MDNEYKQAADSLGFNTAESYDEVKDKAYIEINRIVDLYNSDHKETALKMSECNSDKYIELQTIKIGIDGKNPLHVFFDFTNGPPYYAYDYEYIDIEKLSSVQKTALQWFVNLF